MGRLLAIMGSGETAPTMAKVHRSLIERVGTPAVLLDTPYGFQENADDISARAQEYFGWWWIMTFPGVAIFLAVTGYNMLGEGLRDATDPRVAFKAKK